VTIPVNTIISSYFLYLMFGGTILVCYLGMLCLLAVQILSNKILKALQLRFMKFGDERIKFISKIIQGIRAIKVNVQENFCLDSVIRIRQSEINSFSTYTVIKLVCGAIYFNAGVILAGMLFLFLNEQKLELGKVFSTLSLLGYIFNFSIVYSNYAIESIFQLRLFHERIQSTITVPHMNKFKPEVMNGPGIEYKGVKFGWKED